MPSSNIDINSSANSGSTALFPHDIAIPRPPAGEPITLTLSAGLSVLSATANTVSWGRYDDALVGSDCCVYKPLQASCAVVMKPMPQNCSRIDVPACLRKRRQSSGFVSNTNRIKGTNLKVGLLDIISPEAKHTCLSVHDTSGASFRQ